jgi:hypothetical protein
MTRISTRSIKASVRPSDCSSTATATQRAIRQADIGRTGTSQNVKDLQHLISDCPVYDDLCARCVAFPSSVHNQLQSPTQIFGHKAQTSLAHALWR